ncbi:hypothetical protein ACTFIZ_000825 [Dictyostelium cf. discoideum]
MKIKKSIVILFLIYFINIINGQNDITFSMYLDQCGSQITVGVNQCLSINSCGYRAMQVTEGDGLTGFYTASFYNSDDCSQYVPDNMILFNCPSDGFPGEFSVTCNTPGVTTHSSFSSEVGSILAGVSSILSMASTAASSSLSSSSASTTGGVSSSLTTISSAASAAASSLSSLSSSSTSGGGGGGIKGATCNSEKSKSTIVVDYINETPYIQCNGSPDTVCSNSLCTSVLPNYTVTCLANNHINCTGISVKCSIGGIEVCELNWQYSTTTSQSDSNSDSKTNFSISNFNNIFSFSNLFLIIFSIILTLSSTIIINNFNFI